MSLLKFTFNLIAQTRSNMVDIMDSFNVEQLNLIPKGFSNNIIWNFGHVISTTQVLCYKLGGKPVKVEENILTEFRKGTKPEKEYNLKEVDLLKLLSVNTLAKLEDDYLDGYFEEYSPYKTSYGVELCSIEDAIRFLPAHEGLHLGYIMALRKSINEIIKA